MNNDSWNEEIDNQLISADPSQTMRPTDQVPSICPGVVDRRALKGLINQYRMEDNKNTEPYFTGHLIGTKRILM